MGGHPRDRLAVTGQGRRGDPHYTLRLGVDASLRARPSARGQDRAGAGVPLACAGPGRARGHRGAPGQAVRPGYPGGAEEVPGVISCRRPYIEIKGNKMRITESKLRLIIREALLNEVRGRDGTELNIGTTGGAGSAAAAAQTYIDFTKSLGALALDTIVYFRSGQALLDALTVMTPLAHAPKNEKETQEAIAATSIHRLLDNLGTAGLDAADVVNGGVYMLERNYTMAALCLVAAIPIVGSALIARKAGKFAIAAADVSKVDAKIVQIKSGLRAAETPGAEATIKEIEKLRTDMNSGVADFNPYDQIPDARKQAAENVAANPEKLKTNAEQVERLLNKVYKETDADPVAEAEAEALLRARGIDPARIGAWYKSPAWKKKIIDLARPLTLKVFDKISSKSFREKFINQQMTIIVSTVGDASLEGNTISAKELAEYAISKNSEVTATLMKKLPEVVDDVVSNLKIMIIDDIETANRLEINQSVLALADSSGGEHNIYIFLPRFNHGWSEGQTEAQLENAFIHELRHVVDAELGKSLRFAPYASSALRMKKLLRTISDRMTIPPEYASYIAEPTEMWVRVESLRDFLGKETLDANDLDLFLSKDIRLVPNDITFFHKYMQETRYDELKEIAAAMNGVL